MKILVIIAVCAALLGLSGCKVWPKYGQGGLSEHRLEYLSTAWPNQPLVPEDGLSFELELLARHLDVLVLEGAELCFPATVIQAKHIEARAAREIRGGLNHDAANDIIIQRKLLARLERQLDYVLNHEVCVLPKSKGQQTPGEVAQQLHEILNADNQFAFASAELNPKYIGRLAEAAKILIEHPNYQLRITGHADAIGEVKHNLPLSISRAQMVARYLMIFGISKDTLLIEGVGTNKPLVEGTKPEIRLTNRRVTIEIIENTHALLNAGGKHD